MLGGPCQSLVSLSRGKLLGGDSSHVRWGGGEEEGEFNVTDVLIRLQQLKWGRAAPWSLSPLFSK